MRTPQRNAGFTLLELLIALALFSTLMALMWSLFGTYTRLADRSGDVARELQVVRSVSRQLRSDLDHFAHLAVPPEVVSQEPLADPTAVPGLDEEQRGQLGKVELGHDGRPVLHAHQFEASFPDATFLRGWSNRLELVSRQPYTVDIPHEAERIGEETHWGTLQFIKYEFRHPKELRTLLQEDPVLNPDRLPPQHQDGHLHEVHPTNPNDSVGLVRETRSWLHLSRDQKRHRTFMHLESVLRDGGQLPPSPPAPERDLEETLRARGNRSSTGRATAPLAFWEPPPELRHRRDHLPEITRLTFRYLDGQRWHDVWDQEERLPQAVEVVFRVDADAPAAREKEFREAHERMAGGASLAQVLEPAAAPPAADTALDQAAGRDEEAALSEYRFVFAITGAQPARGAEPASPEEILP